MQKTLTKIVCLSVALSVFAPFAFASASNMNCVAPVRNLKLGMTGSDVLALQQFLNTRAVTRVSTSGAGAPGMETDYFGAKTLAAAIKYQELFASAILLPVGLAQGTGFVGPSTRAHIAEQCAAKTVSPAPVVVPPSTSMTPPAPAVASTTPPTPTTSKQDTSKNASTSVVSQLPSMPLFSDKIPYIMQPSPYAVERGGTFSIIGGGFSQNGNTVHIGDTAVSGVKPNAFGGLDVVVPSTVAYGSNDLWVTNEKGETPKQFIDVVVANAIPPVVTDFTPKEGFQGTVITVVGTGFTATGNTVRSSGGDIHGIPSSDGKTLQFTATLPIPELQTGQDISNMNIREPFGFAVINENGISNWEVFYFKI